MRKYKLFILLLALVSFGACKDSYFIEDGINNGKLNMSTYEFLQSRPELFDSVLMAINYADLQEYYKTENVTFFVPQNHSVYAAMKSINSFMKTKLVTNPSKTVKDSLNYPRDTVLMEHISKEVWRSFLLNNTLADKRMLNSFKTPAEYHVSLSGEAVGTVIKADAWQGVEGAGAKVLSYQLFRPSYSVANKIDSIQIRVITSDLQTKNGVVHVLDRQHEFGLNSRGFIKKQ